MHRLLVTMFACMMALTIGCGDDDTGNTGDNGGGAAGVGSQPNDTGSGQNNTGGGGGDACSRACAKAAEVGCSADDEAQCVSECQSARATCASEIDALSNCYAAQPTSDFECDFGEAELATGACDSQEAAAFTCLLGG